MQFYVKLLVFMRLRLHYISLASCCEHIPLSSYIILQKFFGYCYQLVIKTKWKYKGSRTNSPPQLRCVAKVNDKLLLKLAPEE